MICSAANIATPCNRLELLVSPATSECFCCNSCINTTQYNYKFWNTFSLSLNPGINNRACQSFFSRFQFLMFLRDEHLVDGLNKFQEKIMKNTACSRSQQVRIQTTGVTVFCAFRDSTDCISSRKLPICLLGRKITGNF